MNALNLTPKEIVKELNRYIVGQHKAKKAVAIALRNRWRRSKVEEPLKSEILPKNILMVGPTGVGKTEIARRIAKLSGSPFIKVEATKFTEVGYVGRDVESIVRDLTEIAITIVKERSRKEVEEKALVKAQERILKALIGDSASDDTKEKFRQRLEEGKLEDKEIEIELQDNSVSGASSFDFPGGQMGVLNIGEIISKTIGSGRTKTRRLSVAEAREEVVAEESDNLIDEEKMVKEALELVENYGIVFIDELDKISARTDMRGGEVSREGVQRDLLPLIEGTSVTTKYGTVKTDNILFIGSGAFHLSSPSDLLPELQGRLPIRVELEPLTEDDLVSILKEPESSLLKQYSALMETEKVQITFSDNGVKEIASIATNANQNVENIGARRLHTIMEKLLEDISFNAPGKASTKVTVDAKFVKANLKDFTDIADLSNFIL